MTIQRRGSLDVEGSLSVTDTVSNDGFLRIRATGTIRASAVNNTLLMTFDGGNVEGNLINQNCASITVVFGAVQGDVTNWGLITMVSTDSELGVVGNYTQNATATLAMIAGGRNKCSALVVGPNGNAGGTATLGGTLTAAEDANNPVGNFSTFKPVYYGARQGTFNQVQPPKPSMTTTYRPTYVQIANPVALNVAPPAPDTPVGQFSGTIGFLYYPDADINDVSGTTVYIDWGNGQQSWTPLIATDDPYYFLIEGTTVYDTPGVYEITIVLFSNIPELDQMVASGVLNVYEP